MAWKILGPDGQPLLTGGTGDQPMSRAYAETVAKRVRSKAVTMTVAVDRTRGREKPTPVTFDTLRLMANRNEWVRAIIFARSKQLRALKWNITVKDEDPSGAAARAAKDVTNLLSRPQLHGSQPDAVHWQQWISMWLEDLLVLDRAVIEKERDGRKWIKALYVVDGATVRPNLDERGAYFHPDAYVQVLEGLPEARFGMEDLSVTMDNPQTDVRWKGYGISPLESLIVSVTADLHAAKYNSEYFTKGSVPDGILHLGEEIDPDLVEAYRLYWQNEIQGKPHAFPIIGGSKQPEFMQMRAPNRDMQFMEYQQWIQQKMCAVFGISPKELGSIDDVNRSTAEDASESDDQKGIKPLAALVKNMIDLEVIGELGLGLGDYLEFDFEGAGEDPVAINNKFAPMHAAGVATGAEWRGAHDMDPDGDPDATHGAEGLRMHLKSDGTPLPSREDADAAGLKAQQDREDQVADDEHARGQEGADADHKRSLEAAQAESGEGDQPTAMPWQPADPEHPDTQAAMAEHDDEHGIGPRNVKKTYPGRRDGHDANPGMTAAEKDLANVFDHATERLVEGLTDLLSNR
jgi:phage portal protein BeeE